MEGPKLSNFKIGNQLSKKVKIEGLKLQLSLLLFQVNTITEIVTSTISNLTTLYKKKSLNYHYNRKKEKKKQYNIERKFTCSSHYHNP